MFYDRPLDARSSRALHPEGKGSRILSGIINEESHADNRTINEKNYPYRCSTTVHWTLDRAELFTLKGRGAGYYPAEETKSVEDERNKSKSGEMPTGNRRNTKNIEPA